LALSASRTGNLELLLDVPVTVSVRLGGRALNFRELMELGVGSTFELERALNEPVEILVNGRPVARGRVVESGDRWAVQVTEVLPPEERLSL
jgi:flagellar motor switch protein FliN/FliY